MTRPNPIARHSLLIILTGSLWGCGGAKPKDAGAEKSASNPAEAEAQKNPTADPAAPVKSAESGMQRTPSGAPTPSATPAVTYTNAELVKKLVWVFEVANNEQGKIFTGFSGSVPFKVLVDVTVFGELPQTIVLNAQQEKSFYSSAEYLAAAKAEAAKVTFEADAAFLTSKMVEEYAEGKVFELTTVKAGASAVKAKYAANEISISVQIASYTAAQITAGKTRYDTAVAGATPSPSCASCHKNAMGVDHSPYYLSQYTDAALLSTIETGLNTDDNYQTKTPHKMTFANANDKAGIIAYLRSLDPNLLPDQQK